MTADHFLVYLEFTKSSAQMFAAAHCGLVYDAIDFDGMVNDVIKFESTLVPYQEPIRLYEGVLCNKNVSRIAHLINTETQLMSDMNKKFVM